MTALHDSGSVKVFPHLSETELAGRKLAANVALSFGVRVIPRELCCGFAPLHGPVPENLRTIALHRPTAELASYFNAACEALLPVPSPRRAAHLD